MKLHGDSRPLTACSLAPRRSAPIAPPFLSLVTQVTTIFYTACIGAFVPASAESAPDSRAHQSPLGKEVELEATESNVPSLLRGRPPRRRSCIRWSEQRGQDPLAPDVDDDEEPLHLESGASDPNPITRQRGPCHHADKEDLFGDNTGYNSGVTSFTPYSNPNTNAYAIEGVFESPQSVPTGIRFVNIHKVPGTRDMMLDVRFSAIPGATTKVRGDTLAVRWVPWDPAGRVDIEASPDNWSTIWTLAAADSNDGFYPWRLVQQAADSIRVRVRERDAFGISRVTEAPGLVTIVEPLGRRCPTP